MQHHYLVLVSRLLRISLIIAVAISLSACQREMPLPAAGQSESVTPPALISVPVNPPRRLTDFALSDHHGAPFNRARLEGAWHLLFFGFTRCPDICPPTLAQLGAVQRAIKARGIAPPQVVFITVDPEHDTPETMALYLANFRLDATGVTGERPQLEALALQLGIYHRSKNTTGDATAPNNNPHAAHDHLNHAAVTYDHSSQVLLVDPEARLTTILPQPLDPQALADLLSELMSADGPTLAAPARQFEPEMRHPQVLPAALADSQP